MKKGRRGEEERKEAGTLVDGHSDLGLLELHVLKLDGARVSHRRGVETAPSAPRRLRFVLLFLFLVDT